MRADYAAVNVSGGGTGSRACAEIGKPCGRWKEELGDMKRGLSFLLLFLLVFTCLMPVTALAAKDPYTYTIRVFAGNMGTIGGEDVVESTIEYDGEAGSYPAWSFDIGSV